jgi:hypothetical protein
MSQKKNKLLTFTSINLKAFGLNWLVRATHSVHIYIVFPLPIKLSYIIFG